MILIFAILFGLIQRQVGIVIQFLETFPMQRIDRSPDATGKVDGRRIFGTIVYRLDFLQFMNNLFRLFLQDGSAL